jgi:hypothetical protein
MVLTKMRKRRLVGPPEKATRSDAYRVFLGALMIPLGITIMVRSVLAGVVTLPAIMMSLAFVGFGVYRVYVGIVRYRTFYGTSRKDGNGT